MLLNLTEEQIIQLAPDAASVKAGKGLATRAKWVLLEHSDRAIWGHCQGSGKTPYQTVIDTKNVAFKCSCPSRKFPCKHGLGLLFLYAAQAEQFKEADEPEWVTSWLSKREEKAEKKEQKAKSDTPVDEAAQAKRQAMRHQKVLNGIDELEIWLKDLLRNGLIKIQVNRPTRKTLPPDEELPEPGPATGRVATGNPHTDRLSASKRGCAGGGNNYRPVAGTP